MSCLTVQRYEDLTGTAVRIVDDLCLTFERQWHQTQTSTIEKLVALVPQEIASVALQELTAVDVACRQRCNASKTSKALEGLTDYEILSEVGRGGMGIVYRAHDHSLDRLVAIKVLLPEAAESAERLSRFHREARVISALNHPNICTIYAVSKWQGLPYLVLEWIEGETFRTVIQRGPVEMLATVFSQVARALAATHQRGIIHRDIKPENLILRPDGFVKVLDFGLARLLDSKPNNGGHALADSLMGTMLGTVPYMSPEQARGERSECAGDVFSLGTVLYEAATGTHPFVRSSQFGTLDAIDALTPEAPFRSNANLDRRLSDLIMRMLSKPLLSRPTSEEVSKVLDTLALDELSLNSK